MGILDAVQLFGTVSPTTPRQDVMAFLPLSILYPILPETLVGKTPFLGSNCGSPGHPLRTVLPSADTGGGKGMEWTLRS